MLKLRGKGRFGGRTAKGRRVTGSGSAGGNKGSKRKIPDGKFDQWWPKSTAIWIHISPFQEYTYEIYDRGSGEVVEVTTTWYEYVQHRNWSLGKGKWPKEFICSAGAHNDQSCLGHAARKAHFMRLDAIKEEKGYRPDEKSPIGVSSQFGLGITIMETIYSVPKMKNGKVHKNKAGQPIYNFIPEPEAGDVLDSGISYPSQFGKRFHWSLSRTHLDWLLLEDMRLRGRCGNCAGELYAMGIVCPDCETEMTFDRAITGEDLLQMRQRRHKCSTCNYQDPPREADDEFYQTTWVFHYDCADCGMAKEGGLTRFDLRLKKKKAGNSNVLDIVEIRLPSNDEEVQQLIQNPLNLMEIFAPDDLGFQKKVLRELAEGLDPGLGKLAKDYTDGEDDEDSGGIDY